MSEKTASRFLIISATVCVLACLGAVLVPVATGASRAFTGSVTTSGLLGLVFTVRNVQLLRATGEPSLPPAVLTTIFGGWFMVAPLLYTDRVFYNNPYDLSTVSGVVSASVRPSRSAAVSRCPDAGTRSEMVPRPNGGILL